MNKKKSFAPIGIFDSGLGGLSILSEIHKQLPREDILYLADSINAPYGEKSQKEIINFSIENTQFLLSKGCKMIVVACNTATTSAIDILREKHDIPFIGIEPAIKPASLQTQTGKIGILATRGTLSSHLFSKSAKKLNKNVKIIEVVGEGIVEAVENNTTHTNEFYEHLSFQLKPFLKADIDHLVLGCSHYPFIISTIKKIIGHKVNIIDSGFAVAKQTKRILNQYHLEITRPKQNKGSIKILTKGTSLSALDTILSQLQLDNYKIVN